jgi:hypothetical protein
MIAIFFTQASNGFAFASQVQNSDTQVQVSGKTIKYFDITTLEERKNAMRDSLIDAMFPGWRLLKWAWSTSTGVLDSREIESQRKTAIDIIRAGKESNTDELEITVAEKAGLGLGARVEDIPIDVTLGKSGNMTLKVRYKS